MFSLRSISWLAMVVSLCTLSTACLATTNLAALCDPANSQTNCFGLSCNILGQTSMDVDRKSLIACLRNDQGALTWKSMMGSAVITTAPPTPANINLNCTLTSQIVGPGNCTPETSSTLCPPGYAMTGRSSANDQTQPCLEMTICSQVSCVNER